MPRRHPAVFLCLMLGLHVALCQEKGILPSGETSVPKRSFGHMSMHIRVSLLHVLLAMIHVQ